jgi:pimeloyl-ACP methyl ester carboxylesterase
MTRLRRALRGLAIAVGGLLLLVLLVALGFNVESEWRVHTAVALPPPAVDLPAPGATPGSPVLILLHGAGLNRHMWDAMRRHLDPGLRVIALDLPGHGARRAEVYTLEAATATVVAAARAVAPAPVVLVGDSLGGYTAMAAAGALPRAQLAGLVLAGCSSNFGTAARLKYPLDVALVRALSLVVDENVFVFKALAKLGVAEPDRRRIVDAGVGLRAVPLAGRGLIGVDFRAMLAAVRAPVLIVNGDLDQRAVAQEASFLAVAAQGSSHRFEQTPHGVSMLRSAEFAALVNGFTARLRSALPPT